MDSIKGLLFILFFMKEFAPVMGVVVLACLLWWGIDPGLLWHSEMSPFEQAAREWFLLEGGWAEFGRWLTGIGVGIVGSMILMPLGIVGYGVIAVLVTGLGLALFAMACLFVYPPILIFVFWMWLYDAARRYIFKLPGIDSGYDLDRREWIGLLSLTVLGYGLIAYFVSVLFIP